MSAVSLHLQTLQLHNLRCHTQLSWHLSPGVNLLTGENGSGKTTLLEAVYLMAHGRSFRQSRSPHLVRHGERQFQIHGRWQRYGPMHLSVSGRQGKTTLRLQGKDIQRRRDVSESFPVLVEAPQGRRIIDGAPGERRRWLDGLVMLCFTGMRHHYEAYLRAVMQRGRLLRRHAQRDELLAWESQIVQHGMQLVSGRQRLLSQLNALLRDEQSLTEDVMQLSMNHSDYTPDAWIARLRDKRADDARVGGLRFGPHVDAVQIHFRGREIKTAGSRGQQKLAAVAIKMAECALWGEYRRLIPVILLDDALEALDQRRQQRLLTRLQASPAQILMTTPDATSDALMDAALAQSIQLQRLTEDGLRNIAGSEQQAERETIEMMMEEAA